MILPADLSSRAFLGPLLPDRYWAKVRVVPGECWEWTASKKTHGYGQFSLDGAPQAAHRLMCEAAYGPLGDLHALHHCDNPPCVNPEHLFPGTAGDNAQDKARKGRAENNNWRKAVAVRVANQRARTHCRSGHKYTDLDFRPDGRRRCRACNRAFYYRKAADAASR